MSENLTIPADRGVGVTRQVRRDRPERQPSYQQEEPQTVIESVDAISPEDAVADSARQLQDANRATAEARRVATEANQRRIAAEAEVQRARETSVGDRQAVVAQALESANAEMNSAEMALQSAIESGDAKAQVAASKAIGSATFRMSQASAELESLKNAPKPQPQQQQQKPPARSAAVQRWLDEHPRFNTDRKYQGVAITAHNEAIAQGLRTDSQEYVDHIDRVMTDEFGDDHGHAPTPERTPPMNNRGGSTAVPPSRGGGNPAGGYQAVKTVLLKEPIHVQKLATGGMKIRMSKEQQADMQEGADACRMPLADYVADQIAIAEERAAGGTGDLITGEGARFE